ncbi:unnamed protein product [Soboliphyme baturini]|uniref:Integrin beta n=1 Tax=Soboliphyme baturini TaxID=241478 RepID=A0A183IE51_9BILA|nr:unnamed protein product [Soboliphyme baturini]
MQLTQVHSLNSASLYYFMLLFQNQDVGTMKRDPYSNEEMKTQLQPQQVRMKMKVPRVRQWLNRLQHDIRSILFRKITPGNICKSIAPAEVVSFNVTVSLKECKTSGDAVVSVGVGGLRDVVALYITPVCGCECEKLENQVLMNNCKLVCGSCVCDQRYTGDICECEIPPELKSADDLVNLCRGRPMDKVCSGRGKCKCGVCECNAPHIMRGHINPYFWLFYLNIHQFGKILRM